MRPIEFRGLRSDGQGWVYGYYVYRPDGLHLIYYKPFDGASQNTYHHVLPKTVGQFTGVTDKNGVKIFEGDKVKCSYFKLALGEGLGVTEVDAELIGVIHFDGLCVAVSEIEGDKWCEYTGYENGEGSNPLHYMHDVYENSTDMEMSIEVIGNIHETNEGGNNE